MNYTFLKTEDIPETLRDKPKWMSCLVLASGLLFLTLSAVSVGAIFGYTYCYIEHRGMKLDNLTQSNFTGQPYPAYPDTEDARYNRTINGALSSALINKLKVFGHALLVDTHSSSRRDLPNDTLTHSI